MCATRESEEEAADATGGLLPLHHPGPIILDGRLSPAVVEGHVLRDAFFVEKQKHALRHQDKETKKIEAWVRDSYTALATSIGYSPFRKLLEVVRK